MSEKYESTDSVPLGDMRRIQAGEVAGTYYGCQPFDPMTPDLPNSQPWIPTLPSTKWTFTDDHVGECPHCGVGIRDGYIGERCPACDGMLIVWECGVCGEILGIDVDYCDHKGLEEKNENT